MFTAICPRHKTTPALQRHPCRMALSLTVHCAKCSADLDQAIGADGVFLAYSPAFTLVPSDQMKWEKYFITGQSIPIF